MAGNTYFSEKYTRTKSSYRIWSLVAAFQSSPTENSNKHRNTVDPTSSTTNSEDVDEGYLCDIFFPDDYLLRSRKATSGVKDKRSIFPRPFESIKSTENSLIWSLLNSRLVFPKVL
ncbi:hypothetical protein GcM1_139002 [Golovinomyces cichoracearum]|uniref:Uncharacterized protein n=1 Tax=Golovinomyces cichoracearum TaxID=62708 RepID=A0A420JBK4_9PEZI|nr:hypothetical protein GcM1_139002 [Golovinomyces cichoracearum]